MKCLATFMAVLLLALNAVPCADAAHDDFHDEVHAAPCDLMTGKDIHANDDGDHVETCSPFCVCVCCHSLMEAKGPFIFPLIPQGSRELPMIYRASLGYLHPVDIFQPPRG